MKKVKSIVFRLGLEGRGIVNYDSGSQKSILREYYPEFYKANSDSLRNNNVLLCKKNFYEDGFKVKISSDALRRGVFGNDIDGVNSGIQYNSEIMNTFFASQIGWLRGYMVTTKDSETIKRKSVLTISDAEQTNDAKTYIEFNSKGDEYRMMSDTSLFAKENCGHITYEANGIISIKQNQFLSSSPFYDRMGVLDDELKIGYYKKAFDSYYGELIDEDVKTGYFTLNKEITRKQIAETGLLINEKIQKHHLKYLLRNLLNLSIDRSYSYARVNKLEIKMIYDVGTTPFTDGGWLTISNVNEIDDIIDSISLHQFYEELEDVEKVEKAMEELTENMLNNSTNKKLTKERQNLLVEEKKLETYMKEKIFLNEDYNFDGDKGYEKMKNNIEKYKTNINKMI